MAYNGFLLALLALSRTAGAGTWSTSTRVDGGCPQSRGQAARKSGRRGHPYSASCIRVRTAGESAGSVVRIRVHRSPTRRSSTARRPEVSVDHLSVRRSIRELPSTERPRERLEHRGVAGLSAPELIGLVWGSGTRQASAMTMAEEALVRLDGLSGLALAGPAELRVAAGRRAGPGCTAGRRVRARPSRRSWTGRSGRWSIRAPRDLAERLLPEMGRLEREELRVVLLSSKNTVLSVERVYQGNVSAALVRVGELFRDAVRRHAAGIIVVHNHPSGDPTPSPDDLHLTAETVAAGRLLDVPVLDHLIIGHDAFISLRDRGITFDRPGGS